MSAYTRQKENCKPVTQASVCPKDRTYKEESKDRPYGKNVRLPKGSRSAMPNSCADVPGACASPEEKQITHAMGNGVQFKSRQPT